MCTRAVCVCVCVCVCVKDEDGDRFGRGMYLQASFERVGGFVDSDNNPQYCFCDPYNCH